MTKKNREENSSRFKSNSALNAYRGNVKSAIPNVQSAIPLFVFFKYVFDIVRGNPSVSLFANKHNRCQSACANASEA